MLTFGDLVGSGTKMLLNWKCDRIWWHLGTLISLAICCIGHPVCLQNAGVPWGASPAVVVSHPGFWHYLKRELVCRALQQSWGVLVQVSQSSAWRQFSCFIWVRCSQGPAAASRQQQQMGWELSLPSNWPVAPTKVWLFPTLPACLGQVVAVLFYLSHSVAADAASHKPLKNKVAA